MRSPLIRLEAGDEIEPLRNFLSGDVENGDIYSGSGSVIQNFGSFGLPQAVFSCDAVSQAASNSERSHFDVSISSLIFPVDRVLGNISEIAFVMGNLEHLGDMYVVQAQIATIG